jgi:xanthine permease XanP
VTVDAKFDEFNLNVEIAYQSIPQGLPDYRPSEKILEGQDDHARLAGFLLRRNANRVGFGTKGDVMTLRFHFEH